MNRSQSLPYDDTPTGHSFADAWLVIIAFSSPTVLAGFYLLAIRYFFGG